VPERIGAKPAIVPRLMPHIIYAQKIPIWSNRHPWVRQLTGSGLRQPATDISGRLISSSHQSPETTTFEKHDVFINGFCAESKLAQSMK
jgi:hypothetical protein